MSESKQLVNYDAAFAAAAREYMQDNQVKGGGQFVSVRGGVLTFGDEELPGNQMAVIVLDSIGERTFYEGRFDPDDPRPPVCYAFARGNEAAAPHESMADHPDYFKSQAESCKACPHNQWGSADTGRGKACQERSRLIMIPAGYYEAKRGSRDMDLHLFDDTAAFEQAEMIRMKLPVMSVKHWAKYVQQIGAAHNLPPYAVITRVWMEPDLKAQYVVNFEMLERLPDDLAPVIMVRHEEARGAVITPYTPPSEEDRPATTRGLRGLRR